MLCLNTLGKIWEKVSLPYLEVAKAVVFSAAQLIRLVSAILDGVAASAARDAATQWTGAIGALDLICGV